MFMSDPVETWIQQMAFRKGKELEIHWGPMKIQSWFNMVQGKKPISWAGNEFEHPDRIFRNLNIIVFIKKKKHTLILSSSSIQDTHSAFN